MIRLFDCINRALPLKKLQEAVGKTRDGLSTKIHAAVGALGNPVRLRLTKLLIWPYPQEYSMTPDCWNARKLMERFHTCSKAVKPVMYCHATLRATTRGTTARD
ncbi:hypothetical protein [Nitrosomonas sp.]|uniref:hypothetical protein n=1 Tax=Nitrosomonas sp. TaxID=42353 RepID=UPI0025F30632|nr:hypothetical protein [Nitrosomonas sp.]